MLGRTAGRNVEAPALRTDGISPPMLQQSFVGTAFMPQRPAPQPPLTRIARQKTGVTWRAIIKPHPQLKDVGYTPYPTPAHWLPPVRVESASVFAQDTLDGLAEAARKSKTRVRFAPDCDKALPTLRPDAGHTPARSGVSDGKRALRFMGLKVKQSFAPVRQSAAAPAPGFAPPPRLPQTSFTPFSYSAEESLDQAFAHWRNQPAQRPVPRHTDTGLSTGSRFREEFGRPYHPPASLFTGGGAYGAARSTTPVPALSPRMKPLPKLPFVPLPQQLAQPGADVRWQSSQDYHQQISLAQSPVQSRKPSFANVGRAEGVSPAQQDAPADGTSSASYTATPSSGYTGFAFSSEEERYEALRSGRSQSPDSSIRSASPGPDQGGLQSHWSDTTGSIQERQNRLERAGRFVKSWISPKTSPIILQNVFRKNSTGG